MNRIHESDRYNNVTHQLFLLEKPLAAQFFKSLCSPSKRSAWIFFKHWTDKWQYRQKFLKKSILNLLFSFQEVSTNRILKQEHEWVKLAYEKLKKIKNLYVLGRSSADRLPIFSIVVTHLETNRFIHHNFVSALLNDLFGVQARGGCACAGPYAEVCKVSFTHFCTHLEDNKAEQWIVSNLTLFLYVLFVGFTGNKQRFLCKINGST